MAETCHMTTKVAFIHNTLKTLAHIRPYLVLLSFYWLTGSFRMSKATKFALGAFNQSSSGSPSEAEVNESQALRLGPASSAYQWSSDVLKGTHLLHAVRSVGSVLLLVSE